jgi:hypothetical protein
MFPVLLFGLVVVGGVVALGLAARSVRPSLAAETSMLRTLAASRGWRFEQLAAPAMGFRLSGRSDDGIAWELARRSTPNVADDAGSSPAVWSTDRIRMPTLTVVIQGRAVHARMRSSAALALAERMTEGVLGQGVPLKTLYDEGREVAFRDAALDRRFVLTTTEPALAARLIDDAVRHALRAWPGENLTIQCGAPGLRVQFDFVALDRATLERAVALGLALARAAPTGTLAAW